MAANSPAHSPPNNSPRTPQRYPEDHPAFQIAAARRMLANEGCESKVAGHVSLRADDTDDDSADNRQDTFWVSTFGYFDETLPDQIIKCDFELNRLEGTWEPSPAIAFHADLYRARPWARSIVHTHAPYTVAISTTGNDLGMYATEACLFHQDQAHYHDDGIMTPVDGKRMSDQLGDKKILIMQNHGMLVVEASLQAATIKAIAFESSAKTQILSQIIGGKEMPEAEAARSKADYHQYFIPMMWNANHRRLQKTHPDLYEYLEK